MTGEGFELLGKILGTFHMYRKLRLAGGKNTSAQNTIPKCKDFGINEKAPKFRSRFDFRSYIPVTNLRNNETLSMILFRNERKTT